MSNSRRGDGVLRKEPQKTHMWKNDAKDKRDRAVGSLLGLAVGDAVGTTLEFQPRDAHAPVEDMVGGGPFRLEPGQWTDDTSMALCLADSLLSVGTLDLHDLADRFVRWVDEGHNSSTGRCFDIGQTVLRALGDYRRTGNPKSGPEEAKSAGNGSIMRLAPAVIRYHSDISKAENCAVGQGRVTHGAKECADSCALLARTLHAAINGATKEAALSPSIDPNWGQATVDIASGVWREKGRDEIDSTGYVISTLEASYWAIGRSKGFREAILLAANLGYDADTVGAVTGQIAGSLWGAAGIPESWRERLSWRDRIEGSANDLFDASTD